MTLLAASLVDGAVVLAIALLAVVPMRRRSAASRHAVLATAVILASLMPLLELVVPPVPVFHWSGASALSSGLRLTSGSNVDVAAAAPVAATGARVPWETGIAAVWIAGALVTAAGLLAAIVRLKRLRGRCTMVTGRWRDLTDELERELGIRRRVAVLQSDAPSILVTCGWLSPAIVLPAGASAWSDARARVVLRHELAHVGRRDAVLQIVAEAVRALHWMNPLAWIVCRRLRRESEFACDDAVLGGGVAAADYAGLLVEIARHLSGRPATCAPALEIAQASTLERRIVAMLERDRNRAGCGRAGWTAAALAALTIGIPLAAAGVADDAIVAIGPSEVARAGAGIPVPSPPPPAARTGIAARQATITGTVLDQTDGRIPGVELTLTDTQAATRMVAQSNASGRFAFRDLQPARYELVARVPGFKSARTVLTLAAGASVDQEITLQVGSIEETITVQCGGSESRIDLVARAVGQLFFPVVAAQAAPSAPVRVGGSIRAPTATAHAKPECPAALAEDTTVSIAARVGVDGGMVDVRAVPPESGPPISAELTQPALDAVRQWTFTPTLLNGQPVEVDIRVTVVFKKAGV